MLGNLLRVLIVYSVIILVLAAVAFADERPASRTAPPTYARPAAALSTGSSSDLAANGLVR